MQDHIPYVELSTLACAAMLGGDGGGRKEREFTHSHNAPHADLASSGRMAAIPCARRRRGRDGCSGCMVVGGREEDDGWCRWRRR